MKSILLLCLLAISTSAFAQIFTEADSMFTGVSNSALDFADVDGDNDLDVFIMGRSDDINGSPSLSANLYLNDGTGNYILSANSFEGASTGDVHFFDADGDDDMDLLLGGSGLFMGGSIPPVNNFYINDGTGNFMLSTNNAITPLTDCGIAVADVDGDNDMDVYIQGRDTSFTSVSKLFTNDGTGNFTEVVDTTFTPVYDRSVKFFDIDGDDDMDLISIGRENFATSSTMTQIYWNDGSGSFTKGNTNNLERIYLGDFDMADIDGDNDLDLILSGAIPVIFPVPATSVTKLFTNDGNGVFTEVMGTFFPKVTSVSIAFADVNLDDAPDFVVSGNNAASFTTITHLYLNDGSGSFTQSTADTLANISNGMLAFADVDNDTDPDLLITGGMGFPFGSTDRTAQLHMNNTVVDADGDGFASNVDCDDTNANVNPDAMEVPYNNLDDDCDAMTPDDDLDGDGFLLADDCDDTNANVNPDAMEVPYNNLDDDCDTMTPDDDLDGDGFLLADDCDDTNANINPDAMEVPYNNLDDDCDAMTPDDDLDGDGFLLANDCDDENANINPDAMDIPNNGIDEDCDGMDATTSTHEISNTIINIFPNPATDFIYLEMPETLNIEIKLFNPTGQLLFKGFNLTSISLEDFSNGIHLLEISDLNSGQRAVERIVVLK